MSEETLWIPSIGEWIGVPNPLTNELKAKRVTKRFRKDGQMFIQCGEYVYSLETCREWIPVRIEMDGYAIVRDPNLWQCLVDLWERSKHG
jgi:hypothetical protein